MVSFFALLLWSRRKVPASFSSPQLWQLGGTSQVLNGSRKEGNDMSLSPQIFSSVAGGNPVPILSKEFKQPLDQLISRSWTISLCLGRKPNAGEECYSVPVGKAGEQTLPLEHECWAWGKKGEETQHKKIKLHYGLLSVRCQATQLKRGDPF